MMTCLRAWFVRCAQMLLPLLPCALAALAPGAAGAIDDLTLQVERVDGDGFSIEGLSIAVTLAPLTGGRGGARLQAASMRMDGLPAPLTGLIVECPGFELERQRLHCTRAVVDADVPSLGRQRFVATLDYGLHDGSLTARIEGLALASGRGDAQIAWRDGTWTVDTTLTAVPAEWLVRVAADWQLPVPPLQASGTLNATVAASGAGSLVRDARFHAAFADLVAGNEAGTLASDALSLTLDGTLARDGDGWSFSLQADSSRGQAYAEPVFVDFGMHPVAASMTGSMDADGRIELTAFEMRHQDVMTVEGSALLAPGSEPWLVRAEATIGRLSFPGAYTSYLQPFLIGTDFRELDTAGSLSGRVVVEAGTPVSIDLALDALSADEGSGRLAVHGLGGALHWSAGGGAAVASSVAFDGGSLLGIAVGATSLRFRTAGRDLELLEPARIPLLDGALELDRFAMRSAGLPEVEFELDANLLPVSVQQLSRAFGWPEFGGQLGGRISDLRMAEGVLTLSTTLEARVFSGRLEISDLRLDDPFGEWPRLYSSIGIYDLDLEQVTSAFAFGRITGRLSGYVNELVLFDWMPVEFDARLYTPPGDRSRHRISQRAVQNIGNLGGGGAGVGAALSSGFMRFFEEFNYDRLGISCRLQNEVCLMDGVDPAPRGGYYLVKGRGLPRINVIGNAAEVDWPRLVAQVRAIMESGGPVVE